MSTKVSFIKLFRDPGTREKVPTNKRWTEVLQKHLENLESRVTALVKHLYKLRLVSETSSGTKSCINPQISLFSCIRANLVVKF